MTEHVQDNQPYPEPNIAAETGGHDIPPQEQTNSSLVTRDIEQASSNPMEVARIEDTPAQSLQHAEIAVAAKAEYSTTPEERADAFAFGLNTLYKLTTDSGLHARCEQAGIDPFEDMDKAEYWSILSDYSQEGIGRVRGKGGDSLRLRALELMATTPAYLLEEGAMNQNERGDLAQRTESLRLISRFHGLITSFAELYPDTRASELTMALLNTANIAIENKVRRQSAEFDIRQRIRGVQHELGFECILQQSGRQFRRATRQEDLQGFDYVLDGETSYPKNLDVKHNLKEIEVLGTEGPIGRNSKGVFVAYSLITDSDLRDRFTIPEGVARQKAQVFMRLLDEVANTTPEIKAYSA